MKRIFSILAIALTMLASLTFSQPAFAEVSAGAKLFSNNCAQCHAHGGNSIKPTKTLEANALEENGKNTIEAISLQIYKGKGAMPPFGKKLTEEQIDLLANYVLEQSQNGWSEG